MIKYITTTKDLYEVYYTLPGKKYIGFDAEFTDADNVYASTLLLLSITTDDTTFVIDLTQLDTDLTISLIGQFLTDPNIVKIGHNITSDWKQIYHHFKIEIKNMHDTMLVERMLYAGLNPIGLGGKPFSYRSVVYRRLGLDLTKELQKSFMEWTVGTIFTDEQIEYAGKDTIYLLDIYRQQLEEIEQKALQKIYDLEMSIIAPTAMMEYTGVHLNQEKLKQLIEPFERFVNAANKALQDMFISGGIVEEILFTENGYSCIKASSNDQMLEALHELGVNVKSLNAKDVIRWDMQNSKGKSGFSEVDYYALIEDEEVAEALTHYNGLYNPYLRARGFFIGASKLYSTYVIGLLEAVNPITKRVHPHFNSYGAMATGRYSSNSPNLQNLPNDGKLKLLGLGQYSIRQCFEAAPRRKFIVADFSGIELVILAVLSGDEKLMYEIIQGDVHTYVAKEALGCKDITVKNKKEYPFKIWRQGSKRVSYSIAYGTTGRNLSEQLNIDMAAINYKIGIKEGDQLIEAWYKLFPDTAKYLTDNAKHAVLHGYVTDVWGRRRNWDRSLFTDKWKRFAAEREGKNAPIQGSSATMTKLAIRLFWERADRKRARIIITVHDEIVVESTTQYAETAAQILKECMEESIRLTLPTIADKVGKFESLSVFPAISDCYDK